MRWVAPTEKRHRQPNAGKAPLGRRRMRTLIFMLAATLASGVQAAPQEPVWSLAQKEKPAVIETLRELVNIESGSRDKEGSIAWRRTSARGLRRSEARSS